MGHGVERKEWRQFKSWHQLLMSQRQRPVERPQIKGTIVSCRPNGQKCPASLLPPRPTVLSPQSKEQKPIFVTFTADTE